MSSQLPPSSPCSTTMTTVEYPQNGWLFPDKRPFWDKTRPDLPYSDAQPKGTKMTARKNTAAKTTTKKETTMTTADAKTKLTPEEREAKKQAEYEAKRNAHAAKVAELLAQNPEPLYDDVVWFINNLEDERKGVKKPSSPLHMTGMYAEHDKQELVYLMMAASVNGWTDNAYATVSQAAKYHGRLADENAVGWELESGNTYWFTAYPFSAFVWDTPSGTPEYDEEAGAVRDARSLARKARSLNRKAKEAAKAAKAATAATTAATKSKTAAPVKMYRVTMPDGTVLEAPSIDELKELKSAFVA